MRRGRTFPRVCYKMVSGTGSRHLVPVRAGSGIRRPARSHDGARKGAVGASGAQRGAPPGVRRRVGWGSGVILGVLP